MAKNYSRVRTALTPPTFTFSLQPHAGVVAETAPAVVQHATVAVSLPVVRQVAPRVAPQRILHTRTQH